MVQIIISFLLCLFWAAIAAGMAYFLLGDVLAAAVVVVFVITFCSCLLGLSLCVTAKRGDNEN